MSENYGLQHLPNSTPVKTKTHRATAKANIDNIGVRDVRNQYDGERELYHSMAQSYHQTSSHLNQFSLNAGKNRRRTRQQLCTPSAHMTFQMLNIATQGFQAKLLQKSAKRAGRVTDWNSHAVYVSSCGLLRKRRVSAFVN